MDTPVPETRFLADRTVGKLAKWLRLLGFDCPMDPRADGDELLARAKREGRTLLTRDTRLEAAGGFRPASDNAVEQVAQVVVDFDLKPDCATFLSRCSVCNARLVDKTPAQVRGLVPVYVFATRQTFRACPECGRIYWAGTHKERMIERLRRILDSGVRSR